MVTDPLEDCADHVTLSGVDPDIEEHSGGVRILKRTSVAMKPWGEDHSICSGRHLADRGGHIVVQTFDLAFKIVRDLGFFEVNVELVKHEMVFDPFVALAGRFELGVVVEIPVVCRQHPGDHRTEVNRLVVEIRRYPPRCPDIDMRVTR